MTKQHSFKELDIEGLEALEAISVAPQFNEWMYQTISSNLNGKILEIGSGIGNISNCFLEDNHSILLTDIRKNYLNYLKANLESKDTLLGIRQLDLVHPKFEIIYKDLLGQFDGVFALNVVEHIEDDSLAIANCYKLLKKGGSLVILVPAYQWLFNSFDIGLEHYRRYTKKSLTKLFKKSKFSINHTQYFNFAGILGWLVSGTILKKKMIPKGQMILYNTLVPIFKIVDKLLLNKIGLSVIVEGTKQ